MENTNPFESQLMEGERKSPVFPEMLAMLKEDVKRHNSFKDNFFKSIKDGDYLDVQDNYLKWRSARVVFRDDQNPQKMRVTYMG